MINALVLKFWEFQSFCRVKVALFIDSCFSSRKSKSHLGLDLEILWASTNAELGDWTNGLLYSDPSWMGQSFSYTLPVLLNSGTLTCTSVCQCREQEYTVSLHFKSIQNKCILELCYKASLIFQFDPKPTKATHTTIFLHNDKRRNSEFV